MGDAAGASRGTRLAPGWRVDPRAEIDFERLAARSGDATLRIGGRRVHGAYDPARDDAAAARRIAAAAAGAPALLLIGTGLGTLAARLERESSARGTKLVCWEPFPALHAALHASAPAPGVVCDPAGLGPALAAALPAGATGQLAVHPGYEDLTHFEQRFALRALRRCTRGDGQDRARPRIISRRALDTLERLPRLHTLEALRGILAGRTAIVAGGGPSLDAALPALRARRGGALLAAPQALARLLAHDVRVDFVVNPDPADLLTPLLAPGAPGVGAVLADTASHPAVLDLCPQRTFLFHLRTPQVHELAWRAAGLPVVDEPFVTVSETAFWLARHLGAQRILLAGVDFASETRDYGAPFGVRAADGGRCTTNPVYFHGARWLQAALAPAPADGRAPSAGAGHDALRVGRLGRGVAIAGAERVAAGAGGDGARGGIDAWLERDDDDVPLAPRLEEVARAADPARARLAEAVTALTGAAVPAAVPPAESPYPAREPWLELAPLDRAAALPHWRALGRRDARRRAG